MSWLTAGRCRCTDRLDGKTVVVTGANTGLGAATATELSARGAKLVVLACRNTNTAEQVALNIRTKVIGAQVRVMSLDLSDFNSIIAFVKNFKEQVSDSLDILVNNAAYSGVGLEKTHVETPAGAKLEKHMAVNHFGHFLLTNLLMDKFTTPGGRVINVSSTAHQFANMDFDDLSFEGGRRYSTLAAYGQSKLANILFTKELAKRLKDKQISVNCLHPGVANTGALKNLHPLIRGALKPFMVAFMKTASQGAQTTVHLAVCRKLQPVTGGYFVGCRETTPSEAARSERDAERLWDISEQVCRDFLHGGDKN